MYAEDCSHSIQKHFEEFDAAHPEVYGLFCQFAWELRDRGRRRMSARSIVHRIRWETIVNPEHDGGYKINDHFSSRYIRKLIEDDPSWEEFFELRELRTP